MRSLIWSVILSFCSSVRRMLRTQIVWESQVGSDTDQLSVETVQDTDPRFQYQEPAWSTSTTSSAINFALFNNGTGQ